MFFFPDSSHSDSRTVLNRVLQNSLLLRVHNYLSIFISHYTVLTLEFLLLLLSVL
jgi:hypothetical protein